MAELINEEEEVVDMDEVASQELDIDEHPIDLTKDDIEDVTNLEDK